MTTAQDARDFCKRYKSDPLGFTTKVFRVQPTDQQAQALQAIAEPGSKISIRSGHGTGKTALLAWTIFWALLTAYEVKVPCTAPTSHQLNDVLWAELYKWRERLPERLIQHIVLNSERVYVAGLEKINFAVARTARKENPEALQGFHAKRLLFVIDEASGVDDCIFDAARGALSSEGARVIMTSNPTRNEGYFYNSHHSSRNVWTTLHFDGRQSPLVSTSFIEELADEFGTDSDMFRVRVAGDFPKAEADQLISLSLIEQAINREQVDTAGPVIWGLDPAYLGDCETALAVRHGDDCVEVTAVRGYDTMETVGWIRQRYEGLPKELRPTKIIIDTIGYGAGVYDRLRELGYPVVGVNVGMKGGAKYNSLRDELWWRYREWLTERGRVPDDPKLVGQSTSIKLLPPDSGGRIRVESKDHMRRRSVMSPDRADALCLTFHYRPQAHDYRPIDRYDRGRVRPARAKTNWAI